MAVLTLALTGCSGGAPSGEAAGASPQVNNGRQLFAAKGCIACHSAPGISGATGTIGPSLAGVGDASKRPTLADGKPNTPENLKQWIMDPQSMKPGTLMPNLGLSDSEANDIVALLQTLK